jgi:ABC-type antimicrobial peptide transport system permease subunit
MGRYRSLPVLAVRRMLGNWRLLLSVVVGTLIAAAILSATAIYADAIRDLGLRHAINVSDERMLDLSLTQSSVVISRDNYEASTARKHAEVGRALGVTTGPLTRQATSATFFPSPPGVPVAYGDTNRPRANLFFRTDFADHVRVITGALPREMPAGATGPIEVLIGHETAERLGFEVGDQFELHPYWDDEATPVLVEIAGTGEVRDPEARYWGRRTELLEARERSWETYLLAVPEETFFGAMREREPTTTAEYEHLYEVRLGAVDARNAIAVANGLSGLRPALEATEPRITIRSDLETVLRTFDEKLFFTRIPLFVLLLQIGGIVAYYLVMVGTMLVERQASEIATLRSRGATTGQLLAQYAVEGGILAILATLAGPPLAAGVISALGPTPAFSALSGGGPLDVHIGGLAYALAAGGALLGFLALMLPAWRSTRTTMVEFKRSSARPRPTPVFMRYYLDVALVLVLALVFWRLSRQEELFTESLFGETQTDPFLLATPAVFMVTVGIVFLRLFPLVLVGVAWLVERTRSVAVLVGMRGVVRNPTHYTRLILLLMFATGVGMFGATFSATLAQSYEDRASYAAGADVRVADIRAGDLQGDDQFMAYMNGIDAEVASPVLRETSRIFFENADRDVQLIAIEPGTFGDVAHVRGDFADLPLEEMLSVLEANGVTYDGIAIPADTRQLGVWLRFPDIRGRVVAGYVVRDSIGQIAPRFLHAAVPQEEAHAEWQFYTADLEARASRLGGRGASAELVPPLSLHGLYFAPQGQVARQYGVVHVGPMLVTPDAPPEASSGAPSGAPGPGAAGVGVLDSTATWTNATELTTFSSDVFEVAQGVLQTMVNDQFRPAPDTPPGVSSAMRYEWQDTGFGPGMRGIRPRTDDQLAQVYVSRDVLGGLGAEPGDEIRVSVGGRYVHSEIAGVVDHFPTYDVSGRGLVIGNVSRLIAEANAALPDRAVRLTEAWFASSDPEATRADLEPLEPRVLVVREEVLLEQQEDPLIAAGWAGILAIAFGAVLLLSAIGFVVYSYLTAQQRGLEFAILRTLGLSRVQVFSVVLFEHLLIIVAGMGLGTLVGLRVGDLMMDFLATDETGQAVLPPFVQQVSWAEVAVVWGILGTVFVITIAAVVALYLRLAVHRALRIGDV